MAVQRVFKIGEVVTCVDANQIGEHLTDGRDYTVMGIAKRDGQLRLLVLDDMKLESWLLVEHFGKKEG